jgi:hypothetical protein
MIQDHLFIMAGKREVDPSDRKAAHSTLPGSLSKILSLSSGSGSARTEERLSIPTLMVSSSDGDELARLFLPKQQAAETPTPRLRVEVSVSSVIFNSDFFGNFDYPKVWASKSIGQCVT